MRIEQSIIRQASLSEHSEKTIESESLRVWSNKGMEASFDQMKNSFTFDIMDISQEGMKLSAEKADESNAVGDEEYLDKEELLKLKLLEKMLSKLTGKNIKFRIFRLKLDDISARQLKGVPAENGSGAQNAQNALQGWGIDYRYRREYFESESMAYSSQGIVRTSDGREIAFDVSLNMSRSYYENTELSFKAGDALKDPLVIDLGMSSVGLSGERMKFDIDFDGVMDNIPILNEGSGYIVYDKNGNDRLDDGSELFGTATGQGFEELAKLDSDRNGWFDEGDAEFDNVKIWVSDGSGNGHLLGLIQADVGAIYLGGIDTRYHFKDAQNSTLGLVQKTSTYLRENGGAGVIHQIDLSV